MLQETTLSLSIDASGAKQGATEFVRWADAIKRKAAEMERAVRSGSQALQGMRTSENRVSTRNEPSITTLKIEGALQHSATHNFGQVIGPILDVLGLGSDVYQLTEEANRRRAERATQLKEAYDGARMASLGTHESLPPKRDALENLAADSFQRALSLEKKLNRLY